MYSNESIFLCRPEKSKNLVHFSESVLLYTNNIDTSSIQYRNYIFHLFEGEQQRILLSLQKYIPFTFKKIQKDLITRIFLYCLYMISGLSTCAADKQEYPFYLAKSKFMLKYIIEFSSCFFPFGTRIFLRGYRMSVYQLHLSHWHRMYFDISYMHKLPFSWGK